MPISKSRVYVYAIPHDDDPLWCIGWLDPSAYFCDVTPDQAAEYRRWWDASEVIDVSKVRMSDWPSLIAETVDVARLLNIPAPVDPKVQPQFAGKLGIGWVGRGCVWIASNMEVPAYREWQVGVAVVETDIRAGTKQISRGW